MFGKVNRAEGIAGFVVSGDHGSAGKTMISIGLAGAYRNRGLRVQPFKKGPDFIDPMWLTLASGNICRNLDFFMMGPSIEGTFNIASHGADLALVEGNQGLFDGLDVEGSNSTSALARRLGLSVVLVVDTRKMTRGIAPLLLGYLNFEKDLKIAGVVLNNVAGDRHESKLRNAIEYYTTTRIFGAVRRSEFLAIDERHLGLTTSGENSQAAEVVSRMAKIAEDCINLDAILEETGPYRFHPGEEDLSLAQREGEKVVPLLSRGERVRIGVAQDRAFTFYYPENLEALENAGAELLYFSPLADAHLPEVDGLFIGGGFPELYMDELERNVSLREEIRQEAAKGMPVYAECGGLMYLSRAIQWKEIRKGMVGVFDMDVEMTDRPQGRGYMVLETGESKRSESGWRLPPHQEIRAHEFHHSRVKGEPSGGQFLYGVRRGKGIDGDHDGLVRWNVLASYAHIHANAAPWWAPAFVDVIRRNLPEKKSVPFTDGAVAEDRTGPLSALII